MNATEKFEKEREEMSNEMLIEFADKQVSELARTGGRSHRMTVPPRIDDTDMLFSELIRRFKIKIEQPSAPVSGEDIKKYQDIYYSNNSPIISQSQSKPESSTEPIKSAEWKISEARRLMFEVTEEKKQQTKASTENQICECGHSRNYHAVSHSINYTEGFCSKCKCEHFLLASTVAMPIDETGNSNPDGYFVKEAEKILRKHWPNAIGIPLILDAMEEYRNQPSVQDTESPLTDEEIEEWANNYTEETYHEPQLIRFMQYGCFIGAKAYRDKQIKGK